MTVLYAPHPLRYEAVYAGFIAAEKEKEQWKEVAHKWAEEAGRLRTRNKELAAALHYVVNAADSPEDRNGKLRHLPEALDEARAALAKVSA